MEHDELAHSLARHLAHECRMVWENIPAGPSGSVRPDVYTMEKSFSNPNPVTYEVKVSLSDFRADVTKAKWKAYLEFSYGVVFAVPKGLVTRKDVPNGCGLIQYNDGIWHTAKRPTMHPRILDSAFMLKLLIGGGERMSPPDIIQPRKSDHWKQQEALRKKWGEDIAEKLSLIEEYPEMKQQLGAAKKELSRILDIKVSHWNFEGEVASRVASLREMANEDHRKQKIADELCGVKENLCLRFDRIIEKYTKQRSE